MKSARAKKLNKIICLFRHFGLMTSKAREKSIISFNPMSFFPKKQGNDTIKGEEFSTKSLMTGRHFPPVVRKQDDKCPPASSPETRAVTMRHEQRATAYSNTSLLTSPLALTQLNTPSFIMALNCFSSS